MAMLSTVYDPGSVTSTATGPGGAGGGGMDMSGFGGLLNQVAARRAWKEQQEAEARAEERRAAAEEAAWRRNMAEREMRARQMAMRQTERGGRAVERSSPDDTVNFSVKDRNQYAGMIYGPDSQNISAGSMSGREAAMRRELGLNVAG